MKNMATFKLRTSLNQRVQVRGKKCKSLGEVAGILVAIRNAHVKSLLKIVYHGL